MSIVSAIVTGLRDIQTTRFAQLASSAIIVFDHVITFDEEVELIWKSSWSMGKILFIINRYYTLISVLVNNYALFSPILTDSFCLRFFQWQGWTGLIACMIAEVILQMRLYALYFLNKKVLALMLTTFFLSSAASAVIMGTVLHGISAVSHPLPGLAFCVPLGVPDYFFAFWIPILVFESLLCGLALYRGFQTFRAGPAASPYQSGRHLVGVLIRDSVFYYLIMFATYLTNLLVWASARPSLLEVPITFSIALSCCLGNRIVLNVRDVKRESSLTVTQHTGGTPAPSTDKYTQSRSISHTGVEGPGPRASFYSPALQLTDIEMAQLRSMRADPVETYGQFIVL